MNFVGRRLLFALPTLFLVITAAFFMMHAAPGSPFAGGRGMSNEIRRNLDEKYGLDQPVLVQFGRYLVRLVHGDLGPSLKYRDKTVVELIADGLPISITIGASAMIAALAAGGAMGIFAAVRSGGMADRGLTLLTVLFVCVPTFVTAPLLVLIFASWLGVLPTAGLAAGWRGLILPTIVLALPQFAVISRLMRAGVMNVLHADYIRTARSRGLPVSHVMLVHVLPAAINPLLAYLGPACAGVITGSLVVEKVFGLPGVGRFFVVSAMQRDYTVVMGVVIMYATAILAFNLLSDVIQRWLDPKTRL
jgi:oligopeptide transport system permease protein